MSGRVKRPVGDFLIDLGRVVNLRVGRRAAGHSAWLLGLRPRAGVNRKWWVVLIHERPNRDYKPPAPKEVQKP